MKNDIHTNGCTCDTCKLARTDGTWELLLKDYDRLMKRLAEGSE